MAQHRAGCRRAGHAAVLLLTVLGLFGMHGLPGAMASSSSGTPMTSTMSMSIPRDVARPPAVEMSATRPKSHVAAFVSGPVTHVDGDDTSRRPPSAGQRSHAPLVCAMDHTNCVAVQRDPGHPASPGAAQSTASRTQPEPSRSPVPPAVRNPRAPPDVSLIELGISRT